MPEEKKFTESEMSALLEKFGEKMGDKFIEAIKEMKKLPAHEQEKLDKQLAREAENRKQRIKEAISEQRSKDQNQLACAHIKWAEGVQKQSHAFRGQVNNDGYFRPVCIRCFKQFPKIKATEEQARGGISLQNIPSLNAKTLLEWHKLTTPKCEECAKGNCAVKDLRQMERGLDPMPTILPDGKVLAEQAVGA